MDRSFIAETAYLIAKKQIRKCATSLMPKSKFGGVKKIANGRAV
jgi:hypothetical protein